MRTREEDDATRLRKFYSSILDQTAYSIIDGFRTELEEVNRTDAKIIHEHISHIDGLKLIDNELYNMIIESDGVPSLLRKGRAVVEKWRNEIKGSNYPGYFNDYYGVHCSQEEEAIRVETYYNSLLDGLAKRIIDEFKSAVETSHPDVVEVHEYLFHIEGLKQVNDELYYKVIESVGMLDLINKAKAVIEKWRNELKSGDCVDYFDDVYKGKWYVAIVISREDDIFLLHFPGFGDRWNMNVEAEEIVPHTCRTAKNQPKRKALSLTRSLKATQQKRIMLTTPSSTASSEASPRSRATASPSPMPVSGISTSNSSSGTGGHSRKKQRGRPASSSSSSSSHHTESLAYCEAKCDSMIAANASDEHGDAHSIGRIHGNNNAVSSNSSSSNGISVGRSDNVNIRSESLNSDIPADMRTALARIRASIPADVSEDERARLTVEHLLSARPVFYMPNDMTAGSNNDNDNDNDCNYDNDDDDSISGDNNVPQNKNNGDRRNDRYNGSASASASGNINSINDTVTREKTVMEAESFDMRTALKRIHAQVRSDVRDDERENMTLARLMSESWEQLKEFFEEEDAKKPIRDRIVMMGKYVPFQ